MDKDLCDFVGGYVECALWASTSDEGEPLDRGHWIEDFDAGSMLDIVTDCQNFMRANAEDLAAYVEGYPKGSKTYALECAGQDFWLTRNGHGTGFWDRGLGSLGTRLSEAAKVYGESAVIVTGKNQVSIYC